MGVRGVAEVETDVRRESDSPALLAGFDLRFAAFYRKRLGCFRAAWHGVSKVFYDVRNKFLDVPVRIPLALSAVEHADIKDYLPRSRSRYPSHRIASPLSDVNVEKR